MLMRRVLAWCLHFGHVHGTPRHAALTSVACCMAYCRAGGRGLGSLEPNHGQHALTARTLTWNALSASRKLLRQATGRSAGPEGASGAAGHTWTGLTLGDRSTGQEAHAGYHAVPGLSHGYDDVTAAYPDSSSSGSSASLQLRPVAAQAVAVFLAVAVLLAAMSTVVLRCITGWKKKTRRFLGGVKPPPVEPSTTILVSCIRNCALLREVLPAEVRGSEQG